MQILKSTPNGQICYCKGRSSYHFEFGNIFTTLSGDEFLELKRYINSIDHAYYLELNRKAQNRRRLLLNIGSCQTYFCLHPEEFMELKELISLKPSTHFLRSETIVNINGMVN